jgi:AraC-like DNA-binding protein
VFLKSYQPSVCLRSYIEDYKIFHNIGYDTLILSDKFIPPVGSAMVFHFRDLSSLIIENQIITLPEVLFVGQQKKHASIAPGRKYDTLIVQFKPTGLFRLFKVPTHEITDAGCVDARLICGSQITQLHELIANEKSMDKRISYLEVFLKHRLMVNEPGLYDNGIDFAANAIITSNGCLKIHSLYEKLSIDERTLRRYFQEQVGVSAKAFSRIVRINNIIKDMNCNYDDIFNIILKYNYFDQTHFINDFKEIVGETPSHFINREKLHTKIISAIID